MATEKKEAVQVGQIDTGLAAVVAASSGRHVDEKKKQQDAEDAQKVETKFLEGVLRENHWLNMRVLAGEYEVTFVGGATIDRDSFRDFLEARGVPKKLLGEAYIFAKRPTAGSIRVRKV